MSKVTSLKVGIDFGTTYSGVAWADTTTPNDINVIQKWPLGGNTTTDKVPTELKYSKDYRHPGYRWGFQVEMEPERLKWFKLLLDPKHEHFPKTLLEASKAGMPPDKMPVDLVTDYLSALKSHITTTFEEKYGKAFMKGTKIEYFLTVPAIWSDAAKALTLRAASSVGLGTEGTVPLITEPEAAAVYSLRILPHDLKIKDTFVIADCGGGTVDLISYEITALNPKLEVKECVGGTGGMCGSSFVNQAFEAWAKSRMGAQRSTLQSSMSKMNMNKYFEEYLKRIFSDDEFPEKFFCTVPGVDPSPAAGIADGFLAITRAEMRALFDPVVSRVLDLVHQQIDSVEALGRDVSAVVLVGGFGGSEYLRKRLKEVCNAKGIELFNPENAWTAVARGACLRGLEGLSIVRSHISQLNYGVHCLRTVASGPGNPQGSYVCPLTGQTKIPNRVNWLIRKRLDTGDTITSDKAISLPFVYPVPLEHSLVFGTTLLACNKPYTPRNAKNRNVFEVCTLITNLKKDVPQHMLEDQKKINEAGKTYYLISFNLKIRLQAALVFSFEFKGKEYSIEDVSWGQSTR